MDDIKVTDVNKDSAYPGFSVVVPTYGRSRLVEKLLRSLQQARSSFKGEIEVLVIDSSLPEESETIRQACLQHQAVYHRCCNDVPRKRNLGIRQARCEIVFFTDSDCEVAVDVFNQHWAAYMDAKTQIMAVLGLTEWQGPVNRAWWMLKYAPSFSAAFSFALWLAEAPWGTCTNFSVRREVLLAIGGFDETMPLRVYGEDVDLGLRLNQAGCRISCRPTALVYHSRATFNSFGSALRKTFMTGRADYHLGRRHPERLLLEFPLPIMAALSMTSVELGRVLLAGAPVWLIVLPTVWLLLVALSQALLSALSEREGRWDLPQRVAAALPEWTFEAGRVWEALTHGQINRLWTKFVYIKEQLVAERKRRIVQMWAMALGYLVLLTFYC